ncbi:MAG: Octaprenyl diphosphate synthase [Myxococcaceae bacterium]|jgi:octaprenyl-diphosphate synthase|nr:Octaprenyl diphosphate synthase [Myxococcaceae bacterium]MEA2748854.1 octaprenyl-diphosphate synthase [Myxococcales bacterium]
MTFAASIHALHDTAAPDRVGDRSATRLTDVRDLISREMADVEDLIAKHIASGVTPASESAKHLSDAGGKRVRPMALLLAHACWSPLDEKARGLAAAAELVHMATLLHDDVIDDGDQRRGRPTSRRVWGNAVSVLAGDLLLVEALRLGSSAAPVTWQELVATLGRLVEGEVIQLRGRLAVSLEESTYFDIVRGKTASLFEWALRAGAREGGASEEAIEALGAFGGHLGIAFQLVDDVLDYDGDPQATGKSMLADLAEGKVTLPLIRAAATDPDAFAKLVADVRTGDASAAHELATRVRASGACERVRDLARAETALALACLELVPECRARDILADVARGLTARVS